MPLKNLFRTHIIQLAEFLKVPREIIIRTPNPDLIPGVSDKYMDILRIDWKKLDLILYGLEKGIDTNSLAQQLNMIDKRIEQIKEIVELTYHMRHHSMAPTFEL
jgi:NAD+ synthase